MSTIEQKYYNTERIFTTEPIEVKIDNSVESCVNVCAYLRSIIGIGLQLYKMRAWNEIE